MTFIVAGGSTVGLAGGFSQGGGHSSYTSYYGLGADQVVRIYAVTANGKLVRADAEENEHLYWAFRGGGGGMLIPRLSLLSIFRHCRLVTCANESSRDVWYCYFDGC